MFGSKYFNHPEILLSSFSEMNDNGKKKKKINKKLVLFLKLFIFIFGIPEIGFQVRSICFQKIIEAKLKNFNPKNILDAGSGIGIYTFLLAKKYPNANVQGWDIDTEKISVSKKLSEKFKLFNTEFKLEDVGKIKNFNKKFDLIINIDVLEHIKDYRKVLNNFYNLLSNGGYLYIHTPQVNQKRIFKESKSWHHEDHVREGFNPEVFKKDFKELGFRIIEVRQTFGFFGKLAWELNHISLKKGFLLAGFVYPFIYVLLFFDQFYKMNEGLGVGILVRK